MNVSLIKKYAAIIHKMVTPRKAIYIHEEEGIYYLARYVARRDFEKVSVKKQNFIRCLWKYKAGDRKAFERISELYLRLVEDFVVQNALTGDILLTCIPRSSARENPLCRIVLKVYAEALVEGCELHNGLGYIKRKKKLNPIHSGNSYSVEELKDSMGIIDKPVCDTVILLDDVVKSGNTFKAAEALLVEAGAEKVYCLSLFKV